MRHNQLHLGLQVKLTYYNPNNMFILIYARTVKVKRQFGPLNQNTDDIFLKNIRQIFLQVVRVCVAC